MNFITDLFLTLWPTLLILGSAGWGVAVQNVLRIKNGAGAHDNLFDCSFVGILVVSFEVLLINFWFGLGLNAGLWIVGIGFFFYVIALWRQSHWAQQTICLFVIVALTSFVYRNMSLTGDAGLYHIPTMNWIADGPVPLGIANLEGRLGFNSAWLLFVSGLRVDSLFAWRHVVHGEIAFYALALSWLVWQFLGELKTRWSTRTYLYLSAIIVLGLAFSRMGDETSTDHAANICAFLAWVVFTDQYFPQNDTHQGEIKRYFLLLVTLTTLAITFRISMLPIIALPLFHLWREGVHSSKQILEEAWPWLLMACLFVVAWIIRGFLMSGCLLYPAASTCISAPWAVPIQEVHAMSSLITEFARFSRKGHAKYAELFNLDWVGEWSGMFVFSMPFRLVKVAVSFWLFTALFVRPRESNQGYKVKNIHLWGLGTFITAFVGILFWFIKAPTPRFSWAFFAIISTAIIYWSLISADYSLPTARFQVFTRSKVVLMYMLSSAGALLLVIILGWKPVTPPEPQTEVVVSRNGWKALRPIQGDQCWTQFPCSPYSIDALIVQKVNDRWFFSKDSK